MPEIWYLRHGETIWNQQERWQGQSDPPLSDTGRAQARRLGLRLRGLRFDRVFTSDLDRCRDTAALALPDADAVADPRLREVHFGVYEGRAWSELADAERTSLRAFWKDPYGHRVDGGETFVELAERLQAWLAELPADGRVAAFTHGGVIRCALWSATGAARGHEWKVSLDNCSITRIGRGRVLCVNDCAHLEAGFCQPS